MNSYLQFLHHSYHYRNIKAIHGVSSQQTPSLFHKQLTNYPPLQQPTHLSVFLCTCKCVPCQQTHVIYAFIPDHAFCSAFLYNIYEWTCIYIAQGCEEVQFTSNSLTYISYTYIYDSKTLHTTLYDTWTYNRTQKNDI